VALNLKDKQAIVSEVSGVASQAISLVAADYRGLTVAKMTDLRAKARSNGIYLRVVRNTLARRAVAGTDFACIQQELVGPLLLAFSMNEPSAAARLLQSFVKENEELKVKFLSLAGKVLAASDIAKVAKLPTKDEAISLLMSVMQAPITKLVRTCNEPHSKMVRVILAVKCSKEAA
jgi:large subunit ribosomal protein L10